MSDEKPVITSDDYAKNVKDQQGSLNTAIAQKADNPDIQATLRKQKDDLGIMANRHAEEQKDIAAHYNGGGVYESQIRGNISDDVLSRPEPVKVTRHTINRFDDNDKKDDDDKTGGDKDQ